MYKEDINVKFKTSVVGNDGRVQYSKRGSSYIYRVRVFYSGDRIELIRKITYVLHPTFRDPVKEVMDPFTRFELTTWAWGEFDMKVIVSLKDGSEIVNTIPFAFSRELEKASKKNIKFQAI